MLSVGDIVGETYRIERLLGEGGMARVFLVSHTRVDGKQFALKLISQPAASKSFLQRFKREAEILGRLNSPHIVNIVDFHQTAEGYPYLVMELLEGEDLAHFLQRTGALQKEVALSIIYQVGQALQSAHNAGIVHRDLKPGNLFVCKNGPFPNYIKVLDFGIAKVANDNRLTADRSLMGTPAYMSPEQARGQVQQIDHRSDQFSLAVILYEMLSGHTPFNISPDAEPIAMLAQIVSTDPPALPFPTIWPAMARALSKNPTDRFPSVKDFVEATGARKAFGALAKSPSLATNTNGEVNDIDRPSLLRWKAMSLAAASVLVVGTAVGWHFLRATPRPTLVPSNRTNMPGTSALRETIEPHPQPDVSKVADSRTKIPGPEGSTAVVAADAAGAVKPATSDGTEKAEPPEKPKVVQRRTTAERPEARSAGVEATRGTTSPTASGGGSANFSVSISGGNTEQSTIIKECATKELKDLPGMPRAYKVVMQRAGALHIVESPPQIYHTDLTNCLRNQFKGKQIPESVTLSIRTNW